ncbi:murein hydrolase activator EnvC family protein [Cognatilysobacter bugurensis]|uniref:Peptidase M23 n=1 Tax=Cognatilysobacter bugurensis TaxID=543356 RepID=A0A918T1L3_9GAMM|nr:peptidoglycan DD-metalloendopeptidase family protein [Lysobacter bugurensis]GHA78322.1 peptidase M23 [Lysobacter bugurensis]
MNRALRTVAGAFIAVCALACTSATAQDRREAERKLEALRREIGSVAAERRRIEGERGDATRALRELDAELGTAERRVRELEERLERDEAALADVQRRRDASKASLQSVREALARLLRAAYSQGDTAPLKAVLAHDRVDEARRALVYQQYLQRERTQRIAAINTQLRELDALERDVAARRSELDALRVEQRAQLASLEQARGERAKLVAQLDARYADRRSREQALGRDAQALERLLRQLRAAAAAREKARREAAARAARAPAEPKTAKPKTPARTPQVGGAGWPASGALLAGFGARMPDGRRSDGLLIGADAGSAVKSVGEGTVVYAEWMTGYGLLAIVDHGDGHMSLYAHNAALLKSTGDRVRRGEALATVGTSGGHGRPALYFELRRNGAPVNPATWLRR